MVDKGRHARGFHLLLLAAIGCCLAATSVLLAAGADERVCFINGVVSANEMAPSVLSENDRDEAKVAALGRMLERGPAFRARSFCWPVQTSAVMGVATAVLAPCGGEATPSVGLGVRIVRRDSRIFFSSFIARCGGRRVALNRRFDSSGSIVGYTADIDTRRCSIALQTPAACFPTGTHMFGLICMS